MHQSPLIDSSIIFISADVYLTQKLLRVIRTKEVSREVFWFRNIDQVKRHFENMPIAENVAVVLDYDLSGISLITQYLNDQGVLKNCDLYSLKAIATEVTQLNRLLQLNT